jgi:hypothetical protein
LLGSQRSPAFVQAAAVEAPSLEKQIIAPGGPAQVPAQQSSVAEQGAPGGAQALRQVSVPPESGTQKPPQHSARTAQENPAARQVEPEAAPRQRSVPVSSARQAVGPPEQQSDAWAQRSPMARQPPGFVIIIIIGPGAGPQRAVPSGPDMQTPEQQPALDPHRSCSGLQPGNVAQREGPAAVGRQRPEQQSPATAQISDAG